MIGRRKGPPRRGRVVDRAFMEFARRRGCILRHKHFCDGVVTFHHVRFCGSPKNDRRGFGLCCAGHLHGWSKLSIEHGKSEFERRWKVSIEKEIQRLNREYEEMQR